VTAVGVPASQPTPLDEGGDGGGGRSSFDDDVMLLFVASSALVLAVGLEVALLPALVLLVVGLVVGLGTTRVASSGQLGGSGVLEMAVTRSPTVEKSP
jgi:hypothetical protein